MRGQSDDGSHGRATLDIVYPKKERMFLFVFLPKVRMDGCIQRGCAVEGNVTFHRHKAFPCGWLNSERVGRVVFDWSDSPHAVSAG